MLTAYLTQTQRLLQNPAAPTTLYSSADLTSYINTARGQVAGESESIRAFALFSTAVGDETYSFSTFTYPNGIQGAIKAVNLWYGVGIGPTGLGGQRFIYPRNWEWLALYGQNTPVPTPGPPRRWAQYGQGAAPGTGANAGTSGSSNSGSLILDPAPDQVYAIVADCVCFPIPLVTDSTFEALPYLWTDAVPFFAAYYALLSSQTSARIADAERLYNHYETFMTRARAAANPSQGRWQYQQAEDPVQALKLGLGKGA